MYFSDVLCDPRFILNLNLGAKKTCIILKIMNSFDSILLSRGIK